MGDSSNKARVATSTGGPIYFFGLIGSLVYFLQVAHGFWPVVLAFLKAIVWPAFLVHGLFKFIA